MMNSREFAPFYTPQSVARALTEWAITDNSACVLDPSCGGCAFLSAALEQLTKLGSLQASSQIFGIDIDPSAIQHLNGLIKLGADPSQFLIADFFDITVDSFSKGLFDVVLGNPPYIRYHTIPTALREKAQHRLLASSGISISGRASYWAYFLLYAIQFLKPGGKLAMILPGAFLHTEYAQRVREFTLSQFEHIDIYLLQERIFEGTEEESVLLCAEGAGKSNKVLNVTSVLSTDELKTVLSAPKKLNHFTDYDGDGTWLRALVPPRALTCYDGLSEHPNLIRLGDWTYSRIGVVTGRNDFFILSEEEIEKWDIPREYLKPIISRTSQLKRIVLKNEKTSASSPKSKDWLLALPDQIVLSAPLNHYIDYGLELKVHEGAKCRQRKLWWSVPGTFASPAYIPIMSASWSHIVVNQSEYTCTNNILRLFWRENTEHGDWLQLAIGSLSSLSQLSAELVGRSYGGGVLKLEPIELNQLLVPILPLSVCSQLVEPLEKHLAHDSIYKATELVDDAIVKNLPEIGTDIIQEFLSARNILFNRRRNHRNDSRKFIGHTSLK